MSTPGRAKKKNDHLLKSYKEVDHPPMTPIAMLRFSIRNNTFTKMVVFFAPPELSVGRQHCNRGYGGASTSRRVHACQMVGFFARPGPPGSASSSK